MKDSIRKAIESLLHDKLVKIELNLKADVLCYSGVLVDGLETEFVSLIEDLARESVKKDKLVVILTTTGGSAFAVERYVNIIRHHYKVVDFIVPDYAYSAGTIFCMSGDNIFMDYVSVLGPIDPQVQNKDGKWVAALGYLDKVNDAIEKSRADTLTQVEYMMVKDLDLSELRSYEQAKELTTDLLKKWLTQFKFKNWEVHETSPKLKGQRVSQLEKEGKATEIANKLNDHSQWKSHGRPINCEALRTIGLKIEDFSSSKQLRELIRDYYELMSDYVKSNNVLIFIQTRKFI